MHILEHRRTFVDQITKSKLSSAAFTYLLDTMNIISCDALFRFICRQKEDFVYIKIAIIASVFQNFYK